MSQPARPDPARAPRARDWPAPAPPAHPQHRSPARRRITTARPTPEQPITAASPAAATGPMATGSAATAARPQISARLPVSDWQIRWRLQPDGRTVLEVTDQAGNLTGLVASTRLPITSVDGAWRGTRRTADGTRQRWALAIGHACPPDGPLTVTFTRRGRRTTIHPATVDGLWAAAVTGHYTAARCHTPAAASARQLTPVTPPATATLNPGPDTRAEPQPQARTPAPASHAGCHQSGQNPGARSVRSATP